jgi:hypothetical protein
MGVDVTGDSITEMKKKLYNIWNLFLGFLIEW